MGYQKLTLRKMNAHQRYLAVIVNDLDGIRRRLKNAVNVYPDIPQLIKAAGKVQSQAAATIQMAMAFKTLLLMAQTAPVRLVSQGNLFTKDATFELSQDGQITHTGMSLDDLLEFLQPPPMDIRKGDLKPGEAW